MEQRAPGHTTLDGSIYEKGLSARRAEIAAARAAIDWGADPRALAKDEELKAMDIACEGAIAFARRHAALAESMAAAERRSQRAPPSCGRSPKSVDASPPRRRGISGRRCRPTGSAIWGRSPSSTAGTR